jgi:repressor of nif and glnA expression
VELVVISEDDFEKVMEAYETTAENGLSVTPLTDSVLLIVSGNGGVGMLNLELDEVKALTAALEMSKAEVTHGTVGNA